MSHEHGHDGHREDRQEDADRCGPDLTDETTSPERQQTKITTYARLHDHEVVGLAEDLDVSGAVRSAWREPLRPGLACAA